MRTKAVAAVVALLALAATPAALAKGSVTIDGRLAASLKGPRAQLAPVTLTRRDHLRSCQVGANQARFRAATETERKAATVACEQPANANLNLSRLKAIEAGALAANG